jgi:hypothetical protein
MRKKELCQQLTSSAASFVCDYRQLFNKLKPKGHLNNQVKLCVDRRLGLEEGNLI